MHENKLAFISESGCWVWMAATASQGKYGYVRHNGRNRLAHRVFYEHYKGPIPDGMCVCHTCDVSLCVNPNHLFVGSHKDNSDDMFRKKRGKLPPAPVRGEKNRNSRYSDEFIASVRRHYAENTTTFKQLAEKFGLPSKGYAWLIVRNKVRA